MTLPAFLFTPVARRAAEWPILFRRKVCRAMLLPAFFAFASVPAAAIQTDYVIHETYQDFVGGELKGVSLHRDGRIGLAPGAAELACLPDAVIWSAVIAPDGTIFVGAGSKGRIYRVDAEGEVEEIFATEELISRAMALDEAGRLYVGTSPDGKVYRYDGEGEPEVYFDPGEAYIWSLLFADNGDLFVGTGDEGRIYRIPAGAEAGTEGEIYFDSDESHISALAWTEKRGLLAGTSPRGYLYRLEGPEEAFVLFNSPDEEIRQVIPGREGELYVATFAGQPQPKQQSGGAVAQAMAALAQKVDDEEKEEEEKPAPAPRSSGGGGSRPGTIYRVDADGFQEPFWGLPGVTIHSVLAGPQGELLVGTGSDGHLFSLAGFQSWTLRQTLPVGSDLSAILRVPGSEDILVFTSNPARIYRLDFTRSAEGVYLSEAFDAEQVARWGRLYVEPESGEVTASVRSGNTEKPDGTWSSWREVDGSGFSELPPARYFQYRLALRGEAEARRARFFYTHANSAPVISALRVVTADLGLEKFQAPPQPPMIDLDQLLRNQRTPRPGRSEGRQQIRAYERPGTVTVAWQVRDPNEDDLIFTLGMKKAGAETWDIIADEVRDAFYSFNGNGLEEGQYQVQVLASDHLANPPGEARTAKRVSEVFLIDNTAPEIDVEEPEIERTRGRVSFRVTDGASIIAAADYIVDGGEPVRLFPDDGIFDAREERFTVWLEELSPGSRTLILRVADEAGNPRVYQMGLTVPPES